MSCNEFGKVLKRIRIKNNVTLKELGKVINKNISYLSDIENGRKLPPKKEVVFKIQSYFNEQENILLVLSDRERTFNKRCFRAIIKNQKMIDILLSAKRDLTKKEYQDILLMIEKEKQKCHVCAK